MTPNTSDSPDAIKNRNIAVVRPPRNWPNRSDTSSISQALAVAGPDASCICCRAEGSGWKHGIFVECSSPRGEEATGVPTLVGWPLRGGANVRSVRIRPLRKIFGVLHDGERVAVVLDHLAPELAHLGLVGLFIVSELADRRI